VGLPVTSASVIDQRPARAQFEDDVCLGLSQSPKQLPCKYLYDARGSRLFDRICKLPEYYLTRTELAIMKAHAADMAEEIGPQAVMIEYGSGSSLKTRRLLDALQDPRAYIPVDISHRHLQQAAARIADEYPALAVLPVCADFTEQVDIPSSLLEPGRRVVYFPGSTIGNFTPPRARRLLLHIQRLCGKDGGLLLGFDLQKDRDLLEAAYDDAAGVTASFSLNLLRRINRELDADFDLDEFRHRATYNEDESRIEIELVSLCQQTANVAGRSFEFAAAEPILTEYSHKYSLDGLRRLAADAGFDVRRVWIDERGWFGVAFLTVASGRRKSPDGEWET
jgi:dimethylhistidine N-methyltransferase